MNDYKEEILKILNDTSLEENIMKQFKLDDIISGVDYLNDIKSTETDSTNQIKNNTFSISEIDDGNFLTDMNSLLNYANNEIDQNDFKRILEEANALISQNPEKISKMSELIPEIQIKTETLTQPIIDDKQILPLDYIDTYEAKTFKQILNDDFQASLVLKKYQQEEKMKDKFFKLEQKDSLTKKLKGFMESITCMTLKNNFLLIGFTKGSTKLFYYDKGIEKNEFMSDEIKKLNDKKQVVCLDLCNYDIDLFAVGHKNGLIIIWEINTAKQRIIIRDNELINSSVINLKFVDKTGKDFSLISSNSKGIVNLHLVQKGFFKQSVITTPIKEQKEVSFLIETFGLAPLEKNNYTINEEWKKIPKLQNSIVVIGNIECIEIYLSDSEDIKTIKVINNPTKNAIPDVCFGFGHTECENDGFFDFSERKIPGHDFHGEKALLVISWYTYVFVYIIQIKEDRILNLKDVGLFKFDMPILKVGFLESSILYIVDHAQKIKIVNTLSISDPEKNQMEGCVIDPREEISILDEINFSLCAINAGANTNKQTKIYYNSISAFSNLLLIQCKNSFIEVTQLCWDRYLELLCGKQEWETMFCTGLDIIERKVTCLRDIPFDKEIRLITVKKKIKEGIKKYINQKVESGKSPESSLLKTVIEVLINIGEVDYLLGDVKTLIVKKNPNSLDVFYKVLEPFILSDELINRTSYFKERQNNKLIYSEFSGEGKKAPFSQMMSDYITKKKEYELSKLLPHYPLEYINQEETINYCKTYDFVTTLIILHRELNDEQILLPFIQLFEAFVKAKDMFTPEGKNNDFRNVNFYSIMDNNNNNISDKEFETSKEYLGHKLFWYINIVLKNQTFPNKDLHFTQRTLNLLIPELFLWYTSSVVLNKLVTFDSYNYFQTLLMFFSEQYFDKIQKIQQHFFDKTKIKYESLFKTINKVSPLESPNLLQVIQYIKDNCIQYPQNDIYIREDLYEFILKISKYFDFDNNMLLEAIQYILSFHSLMKDSMNNTFDKFKCHYRLIFEVHEFIRDLSNSYLNPTIDKIFKKNEDELIRKDTENINILISKSENSPYKNVHIHLLTLNGQYQKALDKLIEINLDNKYLTANEDFYAFNYIDMLLQQSESNEAVIKNIILERLPFFGEISIKEVSDLIDKLFSDREKEAIEAFDAFPKLQYELVEVEIEKFIKKNEKSEDSYQSQLKDLLIKQIELLIKLNWKNLILGKLMKKPNYYFTLDECLNLCRDNDVIDACIFLYNKREQFKEAILMGIKEIRNIVEKIKKNILELQYDNSEHLNNLEEYIKKCINICELCSERSDPSEANELWISLFDELCKTIKSLSNQLPQGKHLEELHSKLFDYLEEFLQQMCCYVSLVDISQRILNNFEDEKKISGITKLLGKMCKTSSNLNVVLQSVKKVQKAEIMNKLNHLKKEDRKGISFRLKICNSCGLSITEGNNKGTFYSFGCGHVTHPNCIMLTRNKKERINEVHCPVCKKDMYGFENYECIKNEEQIDSQEQYVDENNYKLREEYLKLQEKRKRNHLIGKLIMFEKSMNEKIKVLHNDQET